MRRPHRTTVRGKILRHQLGERPVRQPDMTKLPIHVQDGDVILQIHLVSHVCRVEDEIELEGQWLGPVLILRGDEMLRAELQGVVFLVGRVRDGGDLGAERVCKHDCKVAQATDTDDGDFHPGADAGADEG